MGSCLQIRSTSQADVEPLVTAALTTWLPEEVRKLLCCLRESHIAASPSIAVRSATQSRLHPAALNRLVEGIHHSAIPFNKSYTSYRKLQMLSPRP